MKKIILVMLVLLTACKKEDPKPEPEPTNNEPVLVNKLVLITSNFKCTKGSYIYIDWNTSDSKNYDTVLVGKGFDPIAKRTNLKDFRIFEAATDCNDTSKIYLTVSFDKKDYVFSDTLIKNLTVNLYP